VFVVPLCTVVTRWRASVIKVTVACVYSKELKEDCCGYKKVFKLQEISTNVKGVSLKYWIIK